MLVLLETIISFSVIMLLLSYLVKSLTSLIKNFSNCYYSNCLEPEMNHVMSKSSKKNFEEKELEKIKSVKSVQMGKDLLVMKFMNKLAKESKTDKKNMRSQFRLLKQCQNNFKANFTLRMKNLSLVCGLALCLLLNINAFTIWKTLYTDSHVRTKFASVEYVDDVLKKYKEPEAKQTKIAKQVKQDLTLLQADVNFGIGAIWTTDKPNFWFCVKEFIGSLLTGIFVSIGAPYWHDLLRALSSLRSSKI